MNYKNFGRNPSRKDGYYFNFIRMIYSQDINTIFYCIKSYDSVDTTFSEIDFLNL